MTADRPRFAVPAVRDDDTKPLFEIVDGREIERHRGAYEC